MKMCFWRSCLTWLLTNTLLQTRMITFLHLSRFRLLSW